MVASGLGLKVAILLDLVLELFDDWLVYGQAQQQIIG